MVELVYLDHNFYTNSIEIIKKTTTFVARSFVLNNSAKVNQKPCRNVRLFLL